MRHQETDAESHYSIYGLAWDELRARVGAMSSARRAPLRVLQLVPPGPELTKIRGGMRTTPAIAAIAAGLTKRVWRVEDLLIWMAPVSKTA